MCGLQEGKQASLAADFSITQFKHLGRLLMVHGRNSYKRSAALSQFVIHRSLCISTMQVRYRGTAQSRLPTGARRVPPRVTFPRVHTGPLPRWAAVSPVPRCL